MEEIQKKCPQDRNTVDITKLVFEMGECRLCPSGEDFRVRRLEEKDFKSLLPRLSNDLTLHLICTKLVGTDFAELSAVSRSWRYLVRSGLLYDTRLSTRLKQFSGDTFIVHRHCTDYESPNITIQDLTDKLALFSPKLLKCHEVPQLHGGLPVESQWIALDGNLYLLGGMDPTSGNGSKRVYSLAMATGEQVWKECASMHTGRYSFACAVFNHKIFAFEGYETSGQELVCGSEVFDPKSNEWSTIRSPESAWLAEHRALRIDHRFFLDGHPEIGDETLQVYDVAKDEWSTIYRPHEFLEGDAVPLRDTVTLNLQFTWRRNFYLFRYSGVYVLVDEAEHIWKKIHTNGFPYFQDDGIAPESVTVFNDDEIILVASWPDDDMVSFLYYAKGFRDKNVAKLDWKVVQNCSHLVASLTCPMLL